MSARSPGLTHKTTKPRGIVRGPGRGAPPPVELVRFEPPPDLAPFVEHFWIVKWALGSGSTETSTLSHPSVHWTVEGQESEIVGVVRGRFIRKLEGSGRVVAVKFKPGGFCAFYSEPLSKLTDQRLPASRVFGPRARRIARSMNGLPDKEAAEQLCDVLRAHGPKRDPAAAQAERIVAAVAADSSLISVDAVCERFDIRPLALQRLFRAKVGVTPKWVIQRYRMHEVMEQITERPALSFATLAADLGFTDQAHFCRVFKEFIGQSPGAYVRALASRR